MTISKGEPWGSEIARPGHVAVARSDAELAAMVTTDPHAALGVSSGDVHQALGRPAGDGPSAQRLPMDVLRLRFAGNEMLAVAHVIVRRWWWRGEVTAVMNVGNLGAWDVAPSRHPNDGRVEVVVVDGSMPLRARRQLRARLPTGSHLPHPQIVVRSRREGTVSVDRSAGVWVDGVRRGRATTIDFVVEPDAYALIC